MFIITFAGFSFEAFLLRTGRSRGAEKEIIIIYNLLGQSNLRAEIMSFILTQ